MREQVRGGEHSKRLQARFHRCSLTAVNTACLTRSRLAVVGKCLSWEYCEGFTTLCKARWLREGRWMGGGWGVLKPLALA